MQQRSAAAAHQETAAHEHFDVIVVGAGISGIGAAVHLQKHCPDRRFVILERRENIGGTWDLFRYPGIRSDSDMHTLGFNFKPWTKAKAIADGPSILDYLDETVREHDIAKHIRHGHAVAGTSWDSASATWTVTSTSGGKPVQLTCNFLFMCSGYYDYDTGYTPEFEGAENFAGRIVHPQHWPADLDYNDKRIVVIGSGATAMTLVPELAKDAARVTMLQRSPTYVVSRPSEDKLANWLRRALPARLAYGITRWRNVLMQMWIFKLARSKPDILKHRLLDDVRAQLGPDYDVETHFTPRYNPWEQRLCLIPDDDLFDALKSGRADVVTDHIDSFTARGIRLKSGTELDADIIVTATGLNLLFLAGLDTRVDGRKIDFSKTYAYRGLMYSGVPNFASSGGYTNASWTLKADLCSEYMCRVLNRMRDEHADIVIAEMNDPDMEEVPWVDFSSGYFARALHNFPKQGAKHPWRLFQNYARDILLLRYRSLDDGTLEFRKRSIATSSAEAGSSPQQVAAE